MKLTTNTATFFISSVVWMGEYKIKRNLKSLFNAFQPEYIKVPDTRVYIGKFYHISANDINDHVFYLTFGYN